MRLQNLKASHEIQKTTNDFLTEIRVFKLRCKRTIKKLKDLFKIFSKICYYKTIRHETHMVVLTVLD